MFFRAAFFSFALLVANVQAADRAEVEFFNPTGTVKDVRQVIARFSEQMVAFGDPRLSDPFEVQCPAKGKGRWADGKNWIYDFEADLPAGIECRFILKGGLKTSAGHALEHAQFRFDTGGPNIRASLPREGEYGIDEEQIFYLILDAPVRSDTLAQNLHCAVAGVGDAIPVRVIQGQERVRLLGQRTELSSALYRLLLIGKRPGEVRGMSERALFAGTTQGKISKPKLSADEEARLVIAQCTQRLPNNADVQIVWGAGITTPTGIATTQAQTLAFHTRPDFSARFSCERMKRDGACIPILPMTLGFTASVSAKQVAKIELVDASGRVYPKTKTPKGERPPEYVESVTFPGPFPPNTTFSLRLPERFRDDAGREVSNAASFPLRTRTDAYPPLAKFSASFGILEAKEGGVLPVTVRNIEAKIPSEKLSLPALDGQMQRLADDQEAKLVTWLSRVEHATHGRYVTSGKQQVYQAPGMYSVFEQTDKSLGTPQAIRVTKSAGRKAFEVVGIPLKKPGFYVVELASPRLGAALFNDKRPYYVSTAALVTNMSAHFKQGRESSLVWVTALDSGKPIPNAMVTVRYCTGASVWQGRTDQNGIAHIEKELGEHPYNLCEGWNSGYLVTARSADDMTFVLSSWSQGIQPWDFKVDYGRGDARAWAAHTVFDRTLLRAGETVHMKHYFRKRTGQGFATVGESGFPDRLTITHVGSDQKYEFDVRFDKTGNAATTWEIPKDAKLGTYAVQLGRWSVGEFRVEEYRLPTLRASVQAASAKLIHTRETYADLQLSYLAGGGASYAPVKLRSSVEALALSFPDYEDFTFANGDVKEGVERKGNFFDEVFDEGASAEGEEEAPTSDAKGKPTRVKTQALALDAAGAARAVLKNLPLSPVPQSLRMEMEFNDANGETLTASANATLWPSQRLVGIQPDSWVASADELKFQLLVVDTSGKPVADARVDADLFIALNYSHRKRLIGGFYAYENVSETKRIGRACAGKTDARGLLHCALKPPRSGNLIIRARTTDDAGLASFANREVWVAGKDDWWFGARDNDRMDVLPEKKRYRPGETAKLQVRMPFRSARALVTVEREGVLESFVTQLSGKQAVIEVPLKGSYAPNVYVSVLALRGRVQGAQPTALIDLGKPAFKLGIAELKVGWQANELKVKVSSDQPVYKVREKAKITVQLARADGSPLPKGAEIAIAAVDQALLELMPNRSWKLLDAMMQQRPLEITTSTAQMQVVGKRHYGRKAVPHGGGGGKQPTRELFDTLLYWNPKVVVNENGSATVEVPLNDSLSAFRIVAVASAGAGLFGTGDTEIRTSQDVMLFGGLPPVVRDSDRYRASFTVRNTSDRVIALIVDASVRADGKRLAAAQTNTLASQTVSIDPGQASEVVWDVSAPVGAEKLNWEVRAREAESTGIAMDKLKLTQKVLPTYPVRVYQGTITQLDRPIAMSVLRPADAVPGYGGVRLTLAPKLTGSLSGVQDYMFDYPYSCMEQRTSIAVALRDKNLWTHAAGLLPSYLDSDGLVKYFPTMIYGDDTLTAYILSVVNEAGWEIPSAVRARMLNGLTGFVQGRVVRYSALPTADLMIRKMAAVEALSRYEGATPELLESINIDPNLWPTSAVLDWANVLKRMPTIPDRDKQLQQALNIIRSRLNFQGTTMGFSTERSDALWWLMISGDSNAVRSVLTLLDQAAWREDMPRLVRGAVGRQHKGHWNTTPANAWGVLALEKFSKQFESVPVTGATEATLDGTRLRHEWKPDQGGSLQFKWPAQAETLSVKQSGSGKPWVTIESLAALPLKQPFSSGYRISKRVQAVQQKRAGVWSRGDVLRVHLDIDAQSDMTWVVVDDPIPSGAAILGSGLGRDSALLTQDEKQGWRVPAYQERTFTAYRAYYEYVPKGKFSLEYTVRLNNPGEFALPATHVEAMYAPEMLGELPNATLKVVP